MDVFYSYTNANLLRQFFNNNNNAYLRNGIGVGHNSFSKHLTSCFVLLLIFLIEFKIRNSYENSHRIHCFNMEIHLRFMQKVIRTLCQMGNNNLRNKVIIFSIKFLSKIKTEPVKYMFILKFVVQLLERNDNLNISFLFSIHLNHQTNRVPQY